MKSDSGRHDDGAEGENPKRHPKRHPYADMGMMIAVAVFVIIVVKCLLFGVTWVSIMWLALVLAYFTVSLRHGSHTAMVKHATTAFLLLSVVAVVSIITFDRKARPKMHAFEGALNDTIEEEEFIVTDRPSIEVVEIVDTVRNDTIADTDDDAPDEDADEDNTADEELQRVDAEE